MTPSKCSLLIVDDEQYILDILATLLQKDFEVLTTASTEEAQSFVTGRDIDLVLCDQKMPRMTGVQLLEWVREQSPRTIRMLMSGYADLKDAVEAINRGQIYRYLFKPWQSEELLRTIRDAAEAFALKRSHEQLLEQLCALNEELEQRVQQRTLELEEANHLLQRKNAILERLALTDELTGLPNRRAIEKILLAEIRRRSRYPSCLGVGLIDADHFKEINTRYLYPGGDQVLVALARSFMASLRGVDSIGRMGGEEFLIVAPETNFEGAFVVAERIRQVVEQLAVNYQGQEIHVTVSVGFAVAEIGTPATPVHLIHQAAAALAEAKASGRNCSIVHPAVAAAAADVALIETAPASSESISI